MFSATVGKETVVREKEKHREEPKLPHVVNGYKMMCQQKDKHDAQYTALLPESWEII